MCVVLCTETLDSCLYLRNFVTSVAMAVYIAHPVSMHELPGTAVPMATKFPWQRRHTNLKACKTSHYADIKLLVNTLENEIDKPSACLTGRRIAELELHIALAHVMKNFKVEYPEDTPMDYIEEIIQVVPDRKMNLVFKDVSK